MDFGWKAKATRLRTVILSAAHRSAEELPVGISKMLEDLERIAQTGQGDVLVFDEAVRRLCWEPTEVHGWKIQATMYLREGKHWWLVYATRKTESAPSDKDVGFLDRVLDHLGADPKRHSIISPHSDIGAERLPFGWWTWQNRDQLLDIQVNKDKKRVADKVRIVPLGTRETDGYASIPAVADDAEEP